MSEDHVRVTTAAGWDYRVPKEPLPSAAEPPGELREALRDEIVAYRSVTFDPYVIADRLLTGTLADMLAENARLRGDVERMVLERREYLRRIGAAEQEAGNQGAYRVAAEIEAERLRAELQGRQS